MFSSLVGGKLVQRPRMNTVSALLPAMAALALAGCGHPTLFQLESPRATGVTFVNRVPESADFNFLNYISYYNGGGVAVGDVNHDGLPDLYFTSNAGTNRLYLNRGHFHFEDVTERAGVGDSVGWKTGVTMADVNGDGWVDIYVSAVDALTMHSRNVLYINNHDGTFTDRTREYGLDFSGYSTQALFFDYDGDGLLDMYLLNYSTYTAEGVSSHPLRERTDPKAGDRLYHNEGSHFVDVSEKAGIYGGVEGFGLGVVATDVNGDGCPDLYITNDFQENDFLYINQCNGTFKESIAHATAHTSRSSMGVDAADMNNDGRPDIFVADMLPDSEYLRKTTASSEEEQLFDLRLRAGYLPQYARNTLQLNRGQGRFSEIGYLAGIEATDWSWGPLFADLDNDGLKDIFLSSGIFRRPTDQDYITLVGTSVYNLEDARRSMGRHVTRAKLDLMRRMPQVPLPSHAFHNNGNLTFTDLAQQWGLARPGYGNGAVYVDLDNDGALDLAVNNVNAPASIYRNRARELKDPNAFLTLTLRGAGKNTAGIGAKIYATTGGVTQLLEQEPTRGFQSSVDPRPHFGLGHAARIDSLLVVWPDRRFQVLRNLPVNRFLTLSEQNASGRYVNPAPPADPLFEDVTDRVPIDWAHREDAFSDFEREPLIPHLLSTEGPALATADVNGDGLDDMYLGGARWQPGRLMLQQRDGSFRPADERVFAADSVSEDVAAAFFDADGDGHPDLYVVSGGTEFQPGDPALRDRLYLNDRHGHFRRAPAALPQFYDDGSCVVPGDFDGDGHIDLFVGGRAIPGHYGRPPRSHLLRNDGTGRFVDVTARLAPGLAEVGMVTSAAWVDYDGDGKLDLVVVGEWMPVRVFHQENGRFVDRTAGAGLAGSEGWWNTVSAIDINGDGRPDLVLGNLGLNSYLRASPNEPVRAYVADFGGNGMFEQILTFYRHGVSYPVLGRDELLRFFPALGGHYPTYASFGASRIEDIFPDTLLARAQVLEARTFASAVALNDGKGGFRLRPLPMEAQFAPIEAVLPGDFDGDGRTDLLVAGNFYGVPPIFGWYDASYGLLLRGRGDGTFQSVELEQSGFIVEGQARRLAPLRYAAGERLVIVARNDDGLQIFRPTARGRGHTASR